MRGQRPLSAAYPTALHTIGDHIQKRRLDLGLLQREAAERIGVTESTLWNWENAKAQPALRWLPSILRFLGYDPRPTPTTVGQALKRYRHGRGITQQELAVRLDVDPSTLARWEHGARQPAGKSAVHVERLLVSRAGPHADPA